MSDQNTAQLTIPNEVSEYLRGILQDAQMIQADKELEEEMISELYARLDSFLTSKIVEHVPPEHLDDFMKLVDEKKSQSEVEQFLRDKIPHVQDVFSQAFAEFRELYLSNQAIGRYQAANEHKESEEKLDK